MQLFKFELIKMKENLKYTFSVTPATFQVLCIRRLVATVLESTDTEHFHPWRKFHWTDLINSKYGFLLFLRKNVFYLHKNIFLNIVLNRFILR